MDTLPDLHEWRERARAWMDEHLERLEGADQRDPDDLAVFHNLDEGAERALLDRIRVYRRELYDAGYGALGLDRELGGAGLPAAYGQAFAEELANFVVPTSTELISVTTKLVGPTLAVHGTPEQRGRFVADFLRTDQLACQLFSEPGAGSDLAAVACRAERDGDGWTLTGQKVWSSGAQFADWGLLLARTDPSVPKHAGMTMFLVPMDADGLEIRPIRQMSGASSFNEVYLDDVRVDDDLRVGEEGNGWRVANATLGMERTASGEVQRRKGGGFDDVLALARRLELTDDPVVRQQLAELYVRLELREATTDRVARKRAAGESGGAGASIGKIVASDNLTRIGEVAAELLGSRLAGDLGEPGTFAWNDHVLGAPGYRLAGGTDEIQRTIIGERVLGLDREPSIDRTVPFSELDRG
jgi:alkylation response protein AidB-like acyl-CoA dehydrogenase